MRELWSACRTWATGHPPDICLGNATARRIHKLGDALLPDCCRGLFRQIE